MNEITEIIDHLKKERRSSEEINSTLLTMLEENWINPKDIIKSFTEEENKKKLKHFDDFLDEELGKYGLSHGYSLDYFGNFKKHYIFTEGTLSFGSGESIKNLVIKKEEIANTDLGTLLESNSDLKGLKNIEIKEGLIKVYWLEAEGYIAYLKNKDKIEPFSYLNNNQKNKIKNFAEGIKRYNQLLNKGYKALKREKSPIILGIDVSSCGDFRYNYYELLFKKKLGILEVQSIFRKEH